MQNPQKKRSADYIFLLLGIALFFSALFPLPLLYAGAIANNLLSEWGIMHASSWQKEMLLQFFVAFALLNILWARFSIKELMDHFFIAFISLFAGIPILIASFSTVPHEYGHFDVSSQFILLALPYLSAFFIMMPVYRLYVLGPMNVLTGAVNVAHADIQTNEDYQIAMSGLDMFTALTGSKGNIRGSYIMAPFFVLAGISRLFSKKVNPKDIKKS